MQKFQVAYIGLNSLFGKISSLLLKQSPHIKCLKLYDDTNIWPALDVSDLNTNCRVKTFLGRDQLSNALNDVDVVIIGDEGNEHASCENTIFINAADKIVNYAKAISRTAPAAIVILAATPLNSLLPLLTKVLAENGCYNCNKVLGSTAADNISANCILAKHLKIDPKHVVLPVIGGSSEGTRVPVLSQAKPNCNLSQKVQEQIVERIKERDIHIFKEKGMRESINKGYANIKFLNSVFAGLRGEPNIIDIVMSKTDIVSETEYFSLPVVLGRKGIIKRFKIPRLTEIEEDMLCNAISNIDKEVNKASLYLKGTYIVLNEETSLFNHQDKSSQQKEIFDFLVRNIQKKDKPLGFLMKNLNSSSKKNRRIKIETKKTRDSLSPFPSEDHHYPMTHHSSYNYNFKSNENEIKAYLRKNYLNTSNGNLESRGNKYFPINEHMNVIETPSNFFGDKTQEISSKFALLDRKNNKQFKKGDFQECQTVSISDSTDPCSEMKSTNFLNKHLTTFREKFPLTKEKDIFTKKNNYNLEEETKGAKINEIDVSTNHNKNSNVSIKNKVSYKIPIVSFIPKSVWKPVTAAEVSQKSLKYVQTKVKNVSINKSNMYLERFKTRNLLKKEDIDEMLKKKEDNESIEKNCKLTQKFYSIKPPSLLPFNKNTENNDKKEKIIHQNKKTGDPKQSIDGETNTADKSIPLTDENEKADNKPQEIFMVKENSVIFPKNSLESSKTSTQSHQKNLNFMQPLENSLAVTDNLEMKEKKDSLDINEEKTKQKFENFKLIETKLSDETKIPFSDQLKDSGQKENKKLEEILSEKETSNINTQQNEIKLLNKISKIRIHDSKSLGNIIKPNIFKKEGSTSNYLPLGDSFIDPYIKRVVSHSLQKVEDKKKQGNTEIKLNEIKEVRRIDVLFNSNKLKIPEKVVSPRKLNKLALLNSSKKCDKNEFEVEEEKSDSDLKEIKVNESQATLSNKQRQMNEQKQLNLPGKCLKRKPSEKENEENIATTNEDYSNIRSCETKYIFPDKSGDITPKEQLSMSKFKCQSKPFLPNSFCNSSAENQEVDLSSKNKDYSQPVKTFSYASVTTLKQDSKITDETHACAEDKVDSGEGTATQTSKKNIPEGIVNLKSVDKKTVSIQTKYGSSLNHNWTRDSAVANRLFLYSFLKTNSKMLVTPPNVITFKKPPRIKNKFYLLNENNKNSYRNKMQNICSLKKKNISVKEQLLENKSCQRDLLVDSSILENMPFKSTSYSDSLSKNKINVDFVSPSLSQNDVPDKKFTLYQLLNDKSTKINKNENENELQLQNVKQTNMDELIRKNVQNQILNSENYYKRKQTSIDITIPQTNTLAPTFYQNLALRKSSLKKVIEMNKLTSKVGTRIQCNGLTKKSIYKPLNSAITNPSYPSENIYSNSLINNNNFLDKKSEKIPLNKSFPLEIGTNIYPTNVFSQNCRKEIDDVNTFKDQNCSNIEQANWLNCISGEHFIFDNIPVNEYNKYNNFPSLHHF